MLAKRFITGLLLSVFLACSGIPAYTQAENPYYPIYAVWRSGSIADTDFDNMRLLGLDGCFLPVAKVDYDKEQNKIAPTAVDIGSLSEEDALGLEFYLIVDYHLWDFGYNGTPPPSVLSMLAGDYCRSAIETLEFASGKVSGVLIRCLDWEPDLRAVAELCYGMRENPAFRGHEGLKFGLVLNPSKPASDEEIRKFLDAADFLMVDYSSPDVTGDSRRLIDKDVVIIGGEQFDKVGKPLFITLPMYEAVVIEYKPGQPKEVRTDLRFDTFEENADQVTTDTAGNPVAVFTRDITIGETAIIAGTRITQLKSNPGVITEIAKTLKSRNTANIRGIALDGLPYEPSVNGYRAAVYTGSLKGATPSGESEVSDTPLKDKVETAENRKAQSKAFWMITLFLATAIGLTGLSVLRKDKYKYDEKTGKLKPKGGNKG